MSEDLIKRSDVIDMINEAFDIGDCFCDRYGLIGAIQSLPIVDRPREWIPCSERLPKVDTMVILSDKKVVVMGRLLKEDEGFYWNMIGGYCNSFEDWSAWMPLPEPWRETDDEV